MAFRVLIIGGTGQVGAAVVRALAAEPSCAEIVMVNRKASPFETIEQDDIGRAFVAEFISSSAPDGVVYLENGAMRQRARALNSPPF